MKLVIVSLVVVVFLFLMFPGLAQADPCLVVYPTCEAIYSYDTSEYYVVTYGHPLYDADFDRGGEVLIEVGTNEIAYDVYQAPNLTGFHAEGYSGDGYFFSAYEFDLVIDGWSNVPTTFINVLLIFELISEGCFLSITAGGVPVEGSTYSCGNLSVSTPTENGNNYSDTIVLHIVWSGCSGILFSAFADENYNGERDGGECKTAHSHEMTVPTEESSWGEIKNIYR